MNKKTASETVSKLADLIREFINKRGTGLALFAENEEHDGIRNYRWAVAMSLSSSILQNVSKPTEGELAAYPFLCKDTSYVKITLCRTFVERQTNQPIHKVEINTVCLFLTDKEAKEIDSIEKLVKALCSCNGREYEILTADEAQLRIGKLIFAC